MPFTSWLNGPLRKEFMALIDEAPGLYDHFDYVFLSTLSKRARASSFLYNDWMIYILLKWLKEVHNGHEIH